MAIFSNKKTKEVKSGDANTMMEVTPTIVAMHIKAPRVTEKASILAERNVYTFDVPQSATKGGISDAIETLYKVRPVKIAILAIRSKKVIMKRKIGRTPTGKKAYVYLKEGDKIELA